MPLNWTSSTDRSPAALVVRLAGELDFPGRDPLEAMLADELATAPPALVLDLADVVFCDSSSLQALLRISSRAREKGIGFALAAARAAVSRPIEILGLGGELPAYATVAAAVDAAASAR